jgi:protein-S-isoprenylcysteine O-methyltransferase Ste14
MYIAVSLILLGWWLLWGLGVLLIYALGVVCAFHARVILAEEPWAARRFASQWRSYCNRVPRWLLW